ncbi:hypothetical protein HNP38_000109 [Chryseobacterium defluvii]|uniref:Uncharacterized protein n=1 Tax=Chryseobacterium defluvii TaxID=160396 RepID=A0A840KA05_9FLAO|nr:hypothetical protein [Chryseobacterium defluvii]MBB4804837.1 hypothetical protein [Chryseobacterium defluvii]
MKKCTVLITVLFTSVAVYGQVGINTSSPKATLDIVGEPSNVSSLDGIIPPRLTGDELAAKMYTADQKGAIVYATAAAVAPSGQVVNVTGEGIYYFDGNVWIKNSSGGTFTETDGVIGNEILNATANGGLIRTGSGTSAAPYSLGLISGTASGQVMAWNGTSWVPTAPAASSNIYNTNGSLTSDRTLTNNGFGLTFRGMTQSSTFSSGGDFTQRGLASSKRASVTLQSDDNDSNGIISTIFLYQDPENFGQIKAANDSRGLIIGTSATTQAAPLVFHTSAGSNTLGTEKARITPIGNMGINTSSPTEKLQVTGNVRFNSLPLNGSTNAIYTTGAGTESATQDQTFTATRTVVADANGVLGYIPGVPVSNSTDATRFLGGTAYVRFDTTSGGTLANAKVIGGTPGTSYAVGGVSATSSKGGINSVIGNGYTISNPSPGIFDIRFDTPLTQIYGISTNIVDAYGTGSGTITNPDPSNPGNPLFTNDNTQVAFISNTVIRVKTGNSAGELANRSFTFMVTGR